MIEIPECCCHRNFDWVAGIESARSFYIAMRAGGGTQNRLSQINKNDGVIQSVSEWGSAPDARAIGPDGYFYLNGQGGPSIGKYEFDGTEIWSGVTGLANASRFTQARVDASGNSYFTAHESVPSAGTNLKILKFNSSGTNLWTYTSTPPSGESYVPTGIAVDLDGNVFVGGNTAGPFILPLGAGNNFLEYHLDSDGNENWKNINTAPPGTTIYGGYTAADASGNVYHNRTDGIVCYDSTGTEIYTKTLTNRVVDFEVFGGFLFTMEIVEASNKFVLSKWSGSSHATLVWDTDIAWTPANGTPINYDFTVDANADVYLCFAHNNNVGFYARYSAIDGVSDWTKSFTSTSGHVLIPPGAPPIHI